MDGSIQGAIQGPGAFSGFRPSRLKLAAATLLISVAAAPAFAGPKPGRSSQAGPETSLSFDALGIPGLSPGMVMAGGSVLTVNFVDDEHLLVTYNSRELVPRIVGDPAEDEDRIVAGELVELPSGKILAHTRWHMHDHSRYLWRLGDGRFLLREGEALSTFAPLANLKTPDPFFRVPLEYRPGMLSAIVVSADDRLLTIETEVREKKRQTGVDVNLLTHNGDALPKPLLYLDFYRIEGAGTEASPIRAKREGIVRSYRPLRLPVDGDGYLVSTGGKRGRWPVEFEAFDGKAIPVGTVESNCIPGLELVSQTQWLAFTCRGPGSDNLTVAAYDFAKHEIWEEPLGAFNTSPAFALAPEASRFAISRRVESTTSPGPGSPGMPQQDESSGPTQEVRVYSTQTGDLLLKVNCTPAFRNNAENFDLSSDGLHLVVVRNGALEIYRLPDLTKQDQEDLAELHKLLPPHANGPVNLRRLGHEENETDPALAESEVDGSSGALLPGQAASRAAATTSAAPASVAAAPETQAAERAVAEQSADGDADTHRKPPTLLNPGEKPEFNAKVPPAQPQ